MVVNRNCLNLEQRTMDDVCLNAKKKIESAAEIVGGTVAEKRMKQAKITQKVTNKQKKTRIYTHTQTPD